MLDLLHYPLILAAAILFSVSFGVYIIDGATFGWRKKVRPSSRRGSGEGANGNVEGGMNGKI